MRRPGLINHHFFLLCLSVFGLVVSAGLRFYQLGSLPPILNRDEAALAYNAVLLSQTGLDEWGRYWPLSLASFGDYKLIGYPALLASFFWLFPVNDFWVRVPSAGAGLVIVILIAGLAHSVWKNHWQTVFAIWLATLAPVLFFYSRWAFEANLGLMWLLLGWWLSILPNQTSPLSKYLWLFDLLGVVSWTTTAITYNTPWLLWPFLILVLIWNRGLRNWRNWWWPTLLTILLMLILTIKLSAISAQKSSITIFADETTWSKWIEYRTQLPDAWKPIWGHRLIYNLQIIGQQWWLTYQPQFMVIKGGGHPWHQLPGYGHLTWLIYILGWLGILIFFFRTGRVVNWWRQKKIFWSQLVNGQTPWHQQFGLFFLTIISSLPSAITIDAPHATRSLLFLVIWVMWASHGGIWLISQVSSRLINPALLNKSKFWLGTGLLILIAVVIGESIPYYSRFFNWYANHLPAELKPGLAQTINQVENQYPDLPVAVVDPEGYQYILVAWYLKIPPSVFFSSTVKQLPDRIGLRYGERLSHYHFIGQFGDRDPTEKILVDWNGRGWVVETFN